MSHQNRDHLALLGWPRYEAAITRLPQADDRIGRVIAESKRYYTLSDGERTYLGEISGRLTHRSETPEDLPAVGDWVHFRTPDTRDRALILDILPRHGVLKRKAARSEEEAQIIAVNLDRIFIVQAMDDTFKAGRLERFLAIAADSGAAPVVVLSKMDLAGDERESRFQEALAVSAGTPIVPVSARTQEGMDHLKQLLAPGLTVCLIGPSGAGKSTLINLLAGTDLARTGDVRSFDGKGRHTTTRRELFTLPDGAILIDTPGMREIGLSISDESLDEIFPDVAMLAANCRFRDCTHRQEPGCALREALETGSDIPVDRIQRYLKLKEEAMLWESRSGKEQRIVRKRHARRVRKGFRKKK